GQRTQATHLPPLGRFTDRQNICCPQFLDENTVGFPSFVNANGLNPNEDLVGYTLNLETMELRLAETVATPGSQFLETFVITGPRPTARVIAVDGVPVNHHNTNSIRRILEVFLVDGQNILQLTNFRREDTGTDVGSPPIFDAVRQQIFFTA